MSDMKKICCQNPHHMLSKIPPKPVQIPTLACISTTFNVRHVRKMLSKFQDCLSEHYDNPMRTPPPPPEIIYLKSTMCRICSPLVLESLPFSVLIPSTGGGSGPIFSKLITTPVCTFCTRESKHCISTRCEDILYERPEINSQIIKKCMSCAGRNYREVLNACYDKKIIYNDRNLKCDEMKDYVNVLKEMIDIRDEFKQCYILSSDDIDFIIEDISIN